MSDITAKEKLDALQNVQDYEVEVKNKLEDIIRSTYDSHCYLVDDFIVGDEFIDVIYSYTCRGYGDTDYVSIPRKWLDEGFDYKAAYEEMRHKAEEQRKKEEAEEKKRVEAERKKEEKRKAKEEYEQYLKLKEKFEKQQPQFHITSVWMDDETCKKMPLPEVYDENGKRVI